MHMHKERGKLYQDPLYGAKVLSPLAVAIADTPEFQRLAGLRQLGFADLVYRGAVHTRLQHSVGTYFVCRTIMRRIVQNHERLDLEHPGKHVSDKFRHVPENSDLPASVTTAQSKWRGLTEVVSAAALLHDLGHVPFGHTLEDEFHGIFPRHDSLGGPRLFEMLFNDSSGLAEVFSDARPGWLQNISNRELQQLIYLVLNWKDDIDGLCGFESVVQRHRESSKSAEGVERLAQLLDWYKAFTGAEMFHPFMSDIVGNTICADLLDYLPRDRQHLGMEPRFHSRLQRYLTIRLGTLYPNEGLRVSLMVTRKGHGGQRRDVATAVMDIMRERYEMAERVYYHHKKASASAMLAKLVEIAGNQSKPRDDANIYPAPWSENETKPLVPHMTHLSDQEFLDYLGGIRSDVPAGTEILRKRLHSGIRYKRKGLYRTLLVVDDALADASSYSIANLARQLRGEGSTAVSVGRAELESILEKKANASTGDVLIYCPATTMQSKVVDARLEIREGRVLPLRVQTDSFVYRADIQVLKDFYSGLWRAYIFVSPALFEDSAKCKVVVDEFCNHFGIPADVAYKKVRRHEFSASESQDVKRGFEGVQRFIEGLPIDDVPTDTVTALLHQVASDQPIGDLFASGADPSERLSVLFQVAALKTSLVNPPSGRKFKKAEVVQISRFCESLRSSGRAYMPAARAAGPRQGYNAFVDELISAAVAGGGKTQQLELE